MRNNKIAYLLLIIFSFTIILSFPPIIVNAATVNSTIAQSQDTQSSSSSKGIIDVILGLLLGNFLGKILNITPTKTDSVENNQVLNLSSDKEVIGFYAEWWNKDTASYESYLKNAKKIKTIAPFWATLNADATLSDRGGTNHSSVVQTAHENNTEVLLLVNNKKEGTTLPIHTVLNSSKLRSKAILELESYIKQYNLDGVNIDFEMVPAADRDNLTAFMQELSNKLKPQGYIISIDVFPKQNETTDVSYAYDYAQLAKYADKIIIMTYDNHGKWSNPGPIADITWVEKNLKYALNFIPKHKLFLGVAAYGYDWSENNTESLEHNAIENIIGRYNPALQWDKQAQAPYFVYLAADGKKHEVWYEDAKSIGFKLDLVKRYDIAGIAIWKLGNESKDYWQTITNKLF